MCSFETALKLARETIYYRFPPLSLLLGIYRDPQPSSRYLSAPWSGADRFNRYFFPRGDNRSARIIRDKRGPLSAHKRDSYEIGRIGDTKGRGAGKGGLDSLFLFFSLFLFSFLFSFFLLISFRPGN